MKILMSRFYGRDATSGVVIRVEPIDKNLSLVTLSQIVDEECVVETRIPVYMQLGQEYVGKPVDVTTERKGFLGGTVEQVVEASDRSNQVRMAYSRWKKFDSVGREFV